MSIKNHSDLNSEITSDITNNGAQLITGLILQSKLLDLSDSSVNILGDTLQGLLEYSSIFSITNSGHLVHKKYVDDALNALSISDYLKKDGSVQVTGNFDWGSSNIENIYQISGNNILIDLGGGSITDGSQTAIDIPNRRLHNISGGEIVDFSTSGLGVGIKTDSFYGYIKSDDLLNNVTLQFPNKDAGEYTVATVDDFTFGAIITALGYTPENISNKGIANGYTPLDATAKISTSYLPAAVLGAAQYQGGWNATTNSPTIPTAATGNKGRYYVVTTPGATSIDGINEWALGDWIISNGSAWQKVDNTDAVISVNGLLGAVTLTVANTGSSLAWSGGQLQIPSATNAINGLAKLYTNVSASNTDGPISQAAAVTALALKEDVSNKATGTGSLASSDTTYPSEKKVKTSVDLKENLSNKATDLLTINDDLYPSVKAMNYVTQAGAHTAVLMSNLNKETANANLVILSDSTGDAVGEWPDLITSYLASLYPAWTVTRRFWNTGTLVYDSPTTIQTGTGARTLAVYIGGASGQGVAYALTNLTTIIPVTPDLVMVSYGHNDNVPSTYYRTYYTTTKAIIRKYPSTGIICIAQNPKLSSAGTYANGLQNATTIAQIAGREGYGFINVMQAFFDYGNYTPLMIDDTHPNSTGEQLWADIVKKAFSPKYYGHSLAPRQATEEITMGVANFIPTQGTPVFSTLDLGPLGGAGIVGGYAFDPSATEEIYGVVSLPTHWRLVSVKYLFTTPTNSTGTNTVWSLVTGTWDTSLTFPNSSGSTGGLKVVAGSTAGKPQEAQPRSAIGDGDWVLPKPLFPLTLWIRRVGGDASDTYGSDAILVGIKFERLA